MRTCSGGVTVASGLDRHAGLGTMCRISVAGGGSGQLGAAASMLAEVVGFGADGITLLPLHRPEAYARAPE